MTTTGTTCSKGGNHETEGNWKSSVNGINLYKCDKCGHAFVGP